MLLSFFFLVMVGEGGGGSIACSGYQKPPDAAQHRHPASRYKGPRGGVVHDAGGGADAARIPPAYAINRRKRTVPPAYCD